MTTFADIKRFALLGLLCAVLSCCSQDGGGTGGTGSPVVALGTVTGFGSIVVNGIAFDIAGATILLDGESGSAADLRLGQVVTVHGTREPSGVVGTAETVVIAHTAKGPITRIDLATNSLVVLGQIVRVDDTTQFGATPWRDLVVGNMVAVSGFPDTDGALRATRVDKTQEAFTPGTALKSAGTITRLDTQRHTFTLHLLQVDFSAAELVNLPGGRLRRGQVVAVTSTQNVMNGVLFADQITGKESGVTGAPGEAAELQGLITRVTAADTFEINGQPVRLTPDTLFERGNANDIVVDVRVEVEGVFDVAGKIVVKEVEFGVGIERQGLITRVTAVDAFEIQGQPVQITPHTLFEGGTAFDLAVNVHVKVEGHFDAAGVLVATEIDFLVELQGLITRVTAADAFEINGQPVRLTPNTLFAGGTAADIAVNVPVAVKGLFNAAGSLVTTEMEFLP